MRQYFLDVNDSPVYGQDFAYLDENHKRIGTSFWTGNTSDEDALTQERIFKSYHLAKLYALDRGLSVENIEHKVELEHDLYFKQADAEMEHMDNYYFLASSGIMHSFWNELGDDHERLQNREVFIDVQCAAKWAEINGYTCSDFVYQQAGLAEIREPAKKKPKPKQRPEVVGEPVVTELEAPSYPVEEAIRTTPSEPKEFPLEVPRVDYTQLPTHIGKTLQFIRTEPDDATCEPLVDFINHPPHYVQHPSGVECIQITEHMNFCLGNAVKYIWRAGIKSDNAIEDLEKAVFYLNREIARLQNG